MDVPYGTVLATIAADLCKEVCDISSDKWHHADESDYLKVSEGRDGTYAVRAKCKYCHKEFIATGLTPDSLSTAYSDYVSTLPAQGYDSASKLIWQPNWSDTLYWGVRSWHNEVTSSNGVLSITETPLCSVSLYGKTLTFDYHASTSQVCANITFYDSHTFFAPVSGQYTILTPTTLSGSYMNTDSKYFNGVTWTCSKPSVPILEAGDGVVAGSMSFNGGGWIKRGVFRLVTPVYSIEPFDPYYDTDVTSNYYISTRVNNFNGDYYDSVTNNYYNNTTIVNETTNNYYDMTTNNNYTMSNWSYDYASRTYFITLEDGTTVTVQFGDDCMTSLKMMSPTATSTSLKTTALPIPPPPASTTGRRP